MATPEAAGALACAALEEQLDDVLSNMRTTLCIASNNSIFATLQYLYGDAITKTVTDNCTIFVFVVRGGIIVMSVILNEKSEVPRFWNQMDHDALPKNVRVNGVTDGIIILMRHAESPKNVAASTDAIIDPRITQKGQLQLQSAIALLQTYLKANGLKIDYIFNSLLTRTNIAADGIAAAFGVPIHYAVIWLQEYMRVMFSKHHVVGKSAPDSSAVALNPFLPRAEYRKHLEICNPETTEVELSAMIAENSFSAEPKPEFPRQDMTRAWKALENSNWATVVVGKNLLQWASETADELA